MNTEGVLQSEGIVTPGLVSFTCARYDMRLMLRPEAIVSVKNNHTPGLPLPDERTITLVNGETYRVKDTMNLIEKKLDLCRKWQLQDIEQLRQENMQHRLEVESLKAQLREITE